MFKSLTTYSSYDNFIYTKKNTLKRSNAKLVWVQKSFSAFLKQIAPNLVQKILLKNNEIIIKTSRNGLLPLLNILSRHLLLQFKVLSDIVVYDSPSYKYRFTVLYSLLSVENNSRITVSTYANEVLPINTASFLYKGANWFEREVWDMFGVFFTYHPDLRRILTDYGFLHHPLRKDFPLIGYKEVFYSEKEKRIVYTNVEANQSFRVFFFNNPWLPKS